MASKDRIEREKAQLKEKRKKEILEASEELFLKKGFPGTTISDIAEACELTNGAIYLYFKNKNEIILIIMTKISNRFADLLLHEDRRDAPPIERIERLLNVYKKTYMEFNHYHILDAQFNILFDKSYPDSSYVTEYFKANKRVFDIFVSVFEEGLKDQSLKMPSTGKKANAELTAHMFLNIINSYVEKISLRKKLMEEEQGISMDEELNSFIDYLIESLRP